MWVWLGRIGLFVIDSLVMATAYLFAHLLRLDFQEPWWGWSKVASSFVTVWIVQWLALFAFRCDRLLWRYVCVGDVPRFFGAIASSSLVLVSLRVLFPSGHSFRPPFGITVFNAVLVFSGLLAVRVLWRLFRDGEPFRSSAKGGRSKRVLLVGAGMAGNMVARELRQTAEQRLRVVGFLDDDPGKQGASIQGYSVLGKIEDLVETVRRRGIDEVIVTMIQVPRNVIRQVVQLCESARCPVRILPAYHELIDGTVTASRIREVDVADLLGREESKFDDSRLLGLIGRKRVLITGAGGSIGRELVRQVARMGPEQIVLFERSEHALYEIDRSLRTTFCGLLPIPVIGDVCDANKVTEVFSLYRPQLVIHAAAYKHVPLMETNVREAVRNNVFGTQVVAEAALQFGAARFVLISTDKAVHPVSVMGMTKRLAEVVIQRLNQQKKTLFSAVRFGNVLASSGSVVPLFREQIQKGGPVTVTHPDMKRYFMTVEEAAHLVLQATTLAKGGEIFVLDMGEPVRIVELAEEMIRLSGLKPYEDVPIVFTGVRLGERLFEELDVSDASVIRTEDSRIFIGQIPDVIPANVEKTLKTCEELCRHTENVEIQRKTLRTLLADLASSCDRTGETEAC